MEAWVVVGTTLEKMDREDVPEKLTFRGNSDSKPGVTFHRRR